MNGKPDVHLPAHRRLTHVELLHVQTVLFEFASGAIVMLEPCRLQHLLSAAGLYEWSDESGDTVLSVALD